MSIRKLTLFGTSVLVALSTASVYAEPASLCELGRYPASPAINLQIEATSVELQLSINGVAMPDFAFGGSGSCMRDSNPDEQILPCEYKTRERINAHLKTGKNQIALTFDPITVGGKRFGYVPPNYDDGLDPSAVHAVVYSTTVMRATYENRKSIAELQKQPDVSMLGRTDWAFSGGESRTQTLSFSFEVPAAAFTLANLPAEPVLQVRAQGINGTLFLNGHKIFESLEGAIPPEMEVDNSTVFMPPAWHRWARRGVNELRFEPVRIRKPHPGRRTVIEIGADLPPNFKTDAGWIHVVNPVCFRRELVPRDVSKDRTPIVMRVELPGFPARPWQGDAAAIELTEAVRDEAVSTLQALSGALSAHDAERVRSLLGTYFADVEAVWKLPQADQLERLLKVTSANGVVIAKLVASELAFSLEEEGRVLHVTRGGKAALRAESKEGRLELPSSFVLHNGKLTLAM